METLEQLAAFDPKHWPGTDGARDVMTPQVQLVLEAGTLAHRHGEMVALFGASGTGKSFAAKTLCERISGWHYINVAGQVSGYDGLHRILRSIETTQHAYDPTLRSHMLSGRVTQLLQGRADVHAQVAASTGAGKVLVLDDADDMEDPFVREVIHLQTVARFGLVLVGCDLQGLLKRHEMMDTRCGTRIPFGPMTSGVLIARLAAWHDLFARTDPRILRYLNEAVGHGNFRRWADILRKGLRYTEDHGVDRITTDIADVIVLWKAGSMGSAPEIDVESPT